MCKKTVVDNPQPVFCYSDHSVTVGARVLVSCDSGVRALALTARDDIQDARVGRGLNARQKTVAFAGPHSRPKRGRRRWQQKATAYS